MALENNRIFLRNLNVDNPRTIASRRPFIEQSRLEYPQHSRRARDYIRHDFIDFELHSGAYLTVMQTADGLTKKTHIAGINLVKRQISNSYIKVALGEDIEVLNLLREQPVLIGDGVGQQVELQLVKIFLTFRLVGQTRTVAAS